MGVATIEFVVFVDATSTGFTEGKISGSFGFVAGFRMKIHCNYTPVELGLIPLIFVRWL